MSEGVVPEALNALVRARLVREHASEKEELVALVGEERYQTLIGLVIVEADAATCKMEYSVTEHFQMTATSLRDVGDFLRHMLAEGFPVETPLTEAVTFVVDYEKAPQVT